MERIWVVGNSGSGKTTLARALGERLGLAHTELDALYWDPGWAPASDEAFRERVKRVVDTERWVVDGNYGHKLRDLYPRATTVVWLDLPLGLVMRRLLRRTAARTGSGVELWNGNRERVRDWLSGEHPLWWTIRTHRQRRNRMAGMVDERWVRLRSAEEVRRWLAQEAPEPLS